MAFCKYCQGELNSDSSVCPLCGRDNAELTPEEEMETVVQNPEEADEAASQAAQNGNGDDAEPADAAQDNGGEQDGEEEPDDAADLSEQAPAYAGIDATSDVSLNTPKKKMKPGAIVAIVIGAVLVLAALALLVRNFVLPKFIDSDEITAKSSYAGTAEELIPSNKAMSKVVATIGDESLTNGVFQIYYWMQFYNLMNSYGDYASYLGLDTTKPFAEQDSGTPVDADDADDADDSDDAQGSDVQTMTWEQYFISSAVSSYKQYTALANAAKENGVTLTDEYQTYLDGLDDSLLSAAEEAGMSTAEEYVQASFGTGTSVEDYRTYMQTYLLAATYANSLYSSVTGYTEADVEAYYDDKAEDYASSGVSKINQNVINVRHILIKPELDEDADGDGTMDASSEAAWTAAEKKAQTLYDQWKEDPTEDNFSTLATANTEDTGSKENGGLYEDVHPGQMVQTFNDWCFDESRQPGDNGLVKSEIGYHIMYYVSQGDYIYWYKTAESDYVNEIYSQRMQDVVDPVEMEVNYKNILVNSVTDMMS